MILGFKEQFVPFVEDGSKTHTIRAGERWKVGMRADLYARPRQKDMRLIFRDLVTKTDPIRIEHSGRVGFQLVKNTSIFIAGNELKDFELDLFAWADGFREDCDINEPYGVVGAFEQMVAFWESEHKFGRKVHCFHGQVMHWDYEERFTDISETGRAVRQLERIIPSLRGAR